MACHTLGCKANVRAALLVLLVTDGVHLLGLVQCVGSGTNVLGVTQALEGCCLGCMLLFHRLGEVIGQRLLVLTGDLVQGQGLTVFVAVDLGARLVHLVQADSAHLGVALERVAGHHDALDATRALGLDGDALVLGGILLLGQFSLHVVHRLG